MSKKDNNAQSATRNTKVSQYFDSISIEDANEIAKACEDPTISESDFRQKYPFASTTAITHLKKKFEIIASANGKSSASSKSPSPYSSVEATPLIAEISVDEIRSCNVSLSEEVLIRYRNSTANLRREDKAVLLNIGLTFALDRYEANGNKLYVSVVPSTKERQKPGPKPKKR